MALRHRFGELLDRLTWSTAQATGSEWTKFREELLYELDVLEKRLSALEEPPAQRGTLTLPKGKQRG